MEDLKGYGGHKEKNDCKASGTGIHSYKTVDKKYSAYYTCGHPIQDWENL